VQTADLTKDPGAPPSPIRAVDESVKVKKIAKGPRFDDEGSHY
jgi:hypothetical protein